MNVSITRRRAVIALLVPLLVISAWPAYGLQQLDQTLSSRFDEIGLMTARGQFDSAIEALKSIISEYTESDEVLRRAYNELINVLLNQLNNETDPDEQNLINYNIRAWAREALTRYPDLTADTSRYPSQINLTYDTLREVMFGRIEITSIPDSSRVFVNDVHAGTTPLLIPYFPVGEHAVTVSHSGYADREVALEVLPGGVVRQEVSLSRERNKMWWLTRVVTPVLVGVGVVVALVVATGEESTPPEEDPPLPDPPAPPTQ